MQRGHTQVALSTTEGEANNDDDDEDEEEATEEEEEALASFELEALYSRTMSREAFSASGVTPLQWLACASISLAEMLWEHSGQETFTSVISVAILAEGLSPHANKGLLKKTSIK